MAIAFPGIAKYKQNADAARRFYNEQAAPFFGFEKAYGDFAQSLLPQLRQSIENPTASPAFQLYAREGLDALRSQYAATGSPSSGPAQVAGGRFMEGLAAREVENAQNRLMAASQFRGIMPQTQEPQYLNAILGGHNAVSNRMNALTNMQMAQNQQSGGGGGFFSDLLGAGLGLLGGPTKALGTLGTVASTIGDRTGLTGLSELGGNMSLMNSGYNGWSGGFDLMDQGFWGSGEAPTGAMPPMAPLPFLPAP